MKNYFETSSLSVGYNGKALIEDIDIALGRGRILTLIGPNGSGKSTILKTVSRQIARIRGAAALGGSDLFAMSPKELAKKQAVVLTDRTRPELYSAREIVSLGRYPYTNMIGRLTSEDRIIVDSCLELVNASSFAEKDFSTLSDGQKQRIIIARALAQQPELLVLDEPTAFLDIKHKLELLSLLRTLAREKGLSVIMSLHEIDLALKASDFILCVKDERIAAFGTPEEALSAVSISELYDLEKGSFDPAFGSLELESAAGKPKAFVVAGAGLGVPVFRRLQRQSIPFASGILFENDIDALAAKNLASSWVITPAFEPMSEVDYEKALELMLRCESVIDAGTPIGALNKPNERLLGIAREKGLINGKYD